MGTIIINASGDNLLFQLTEQKDSVFKQLDSLWDKLQEEKNYTDISQLAYCPNNIA